MTAARCWYREPEPPGFEAPRGEGPLPILSTTPQSAVSEVPAVKRRQQYVAQPVRAEIDLSEILQASQQQEELQQEVSFRWCFVSSASKQGLYLPWLRLDY